MSEFSTVIYSKNNGVAWIRLNRPEALNAFNAQLRRELMVAITAANDDENVQVVVLQGEGRGFSAGADLSEDYREGHATIDQQIIQEYKPILMGINTSDKIFISAIHGAAAGIGSALAMTCDLTIMSEDAYIYQAFAAIGLIPDGGASWHLVNTIGYKRAFQLVVESEKISAQQCLDLGLTNKVVAGEEFDVKVKAWAEKLATGAPIAHSHIKKALNRAVTFDLESVIDLEAVLQNDTISSEDFKEGSAAFFERRKPTFTGC